MYSRRVGNYVTDPNCPGALILQGAAHSVIDQQTLLLEGHDTTIQDLKTAVLNLMAMSQNQDEIIHQLEAKIQSQDEIIHQLREKKNAR